MKNLRQFAFAVVAVLIFTSAALADPPSRVARLKYISGQVSVQPGGVDEWVAASINRPMTTSDRVWTDKDSRAELHLGSSALRMNSETSVTLSNISDNTVQVELHQGTLNLRIAQLYDSEIYEVDTPNLAFTITRSGDYRFDVDAVGDTTNIIVRKGEGEATGDGPSVRLRSREQTKFYDGKSLAHEMIGEAPRYDGFDDWCRVRSDREDRAESARYVSRYMVGYEDLDGYGRWVTMPPYGPVWVPAHVVADWAPYRYGHWIWVEPWGWTWVDDAPWGFAPFHYGRWIHTGGYWGWCPGPVHVRPYYAPALVAWVGGSNWGVGISFGGGGGYGWFPLGWGEPYVPHYRVSRTYFQNVNVTNTRITNITYVTNNYYNNTRNFNNIHYVNNRVPGAVTVVNRETIVNGRPVGRDKIIIHDRDWKDRDKAPIMAGPPVAPSRRSVLGEHAGGPAAAPPRRIVERPVVSRERPPARPAPWAERERDYARDPGRPLDRPRDERAGRPDDRGRPEVPGRDVQHPGQRDADQPSEHSRRDVPANVPNGRDRDRQDVDTGSNRQPDRPTRVVPRPPERNANMRDGDDRGRPNPAIDRGDDNRGAGNRNAAERQVPRPPERNAGMRDTEDRGRPTPNVDRGNDNRGGRERDAAARDVPHPPNAENTPARGRGQQEAEERPVPRPRSDINVNRDNSPRVVGGGNSRADRDESPRGNQRVADVPRPDSRNAETRREAPVVRETNSSPVYRPAAPPRQEQRPAEVRREAPVERNAGPVQRSAPPERRAEMPRQESRAPEVRREAPAPQRQAAPSGGRSSGGGKSGGKQESHGQGKGEGKGESGKKD